LRSAVFGDHEILLQTAAIERLAAAAEEMADRSIEWADFDFMLADMATQLGRVAAFFGFENNPDPLSAIASGPLMRRYSKDPNYEYSPRLREDLINQEVGLQGREIDGALAMLREAAEKSPLLARALDRAQG